MTKKDKIENLFVLDASKFWESCWIVFFVNALVSILASYGIKFNFDVDLKVNLLPKLLLITIVDIVFFAIIVFYVFEKINKTNDFLKFIIPFNWIQALQAVMMLFFTLFGLFLPAPIFYFFGFFLVVWVTFSLWRIGKDEIGLTGWASAGMIILSVLTETSVRLFSMYISKIMV